MKKSKLQASIALLSLLVMFNPLAALAGKPAAKKKPAPAPTTQQKPMDPYQRAKTELPPNYYVTYIIMDRILRANGLNKTPWRLVVTGDGEEVNAAASDYNLITLHGGLFEQLEGNPDALACAIGHEVGHHVRQHLGFGAAQKAEAAALAQVEAEEEKKGKKKNAQTRTIFGAAATFLGQQFLGGSTAGNVVSGTGTIVGATGQRDLQNSAQIEQEIDEKTQKKIQAKLIEINHKQEIEGDESGYIYMVKAGFPAEGCFTMLDILGRGYAGHLSDETHPGASLRKEKLQKFIADNPPEPLKAEGANLLQTSKPLSYENFKTDREDEEGNSYTISGLKIKAPGNTTTKLEQMIGQ